MSVLIKGMEMPENCGLCPLWYGKTFTDYCCADPEGREANTFGVFRPKWCPLEEVKEERDGKTEQSTLRDLPES